MDSIESKLWQPARRPCPRTNIKSWTTPPSEISCASSTRTKLKQVSGDVFGRIYEYFLTQFRRPEGPRQRRILHARLPGLTHRPRARPPARHRARPGLRLGRHVRPERTHGRRARPKPHRATDLPWSGEEHHHHPAGQDESGRPTVSKEMFSRPSPITKTPTNWPARPIT